MNLKKDKFNKNTFSFDVILKYVFIFGFIFFVAFYFYKAYTQKRNENNYFKLDRPEIMVNSDFNNSDYTVFRFSKPDSYEAFLNKRIKSSDEQINIIKTNYWKEQKGE